MCPAPVFACPEFARELADVELQEIFRRAIGGIGDGRRVDCLAKRAILSRFQRRGWGKAWEGWAIGPQNGRGNAVDVGHGKQVEGERWRTDREANNGEGEKDGCERTAQGWNAGGRNRDGGRGQAIATNGRRAHGARLAAA